MLQKATLLVCFFTFLKDIWICFNSCQSNLNLSGPDDWCSFFQSLSPLLLLSVYPAFILCLTHFSYLCILFCLFVFIYLSSPLSSLWSDARLISLWVLLSKVHPESTQPFSAETAQSSMFMVLHKDSISPYKGVFRGILQYKGVNLICYKTSATLSFHTDECFSTRHLHVNDDC